VIVIDTDQGQSGSSATDREGFQRLVTEVSLGRAGIILGLEVSRLARNCADWHRLLEICALSDTLILDEDGLYDPKHFNDRLLLGMKGALSEAELHVLHARLQGGIVSKARRGELRKPLPTGLVYNAQNQIVLDPDRQVRQTLFTFFCTFERLGSATATVRFFKKEKLLFPRRLRRGMRQVWATLTHSLARAVLHNPRYAGCYVHGRSRTRRTPEGKLKTARLPPDQWDVILPGAHAGYVTWEQYQRNRETLRKNSRAHGSERRQPPREGPALLQGLTICGTCGKRMTQRYRVWKGTLRPEYCCQRDGIQNGGPACQVIPGTAIDQEIGAMLVQMLQPLTLEVSLAVQQELESRLDEADRLRQQHVERARHEADLARERFMAVDPHNRLVADTLEAEWNAKLRALQDAQEQCHQQQQTDRQMLTEEKRALIHSLATDFPKLWNDPQTSHRDRKRMVQLLIEDVTLTRGEQITLAIRFKGGATQTRTLPLPQPAYMSWQTNPEIVALIDKWLDDLSDEQIAVRLNEQGHRSGKGKPFTRITITNIRVSYALKGRYERLRAKGLLTLTEISRRLGVARSTVRLWRRHGLLKAAHTGKVFLYEPVDPETIRKNQGVKMTDPRRSPNSVPSPEQEEV
jgi:DNA invertase Pin-like site-specific DNA recombinase